MPETLPNCVLPNKFVTSRDGTKWFPLFCANCGKQSPYMVRDTLIMQPFGFYLCNDPCVKLYGAPAGTMLMPDQLFWRRVGEIQQEEFGHILSDEELQTQLADVNSSMSKLEREARR
jgi:hypothetical protein